MLIRVVRAGLVLLFLKGLLREVGWDLVEEGVLKSFMWSYYL